MIYRKTGIALPSSLSPSGFRESTKQHRALKHMKGIQPGLLTNSYLSRPQFTGTAAEESIRSHLPHADRKWGHYQTGAWRWQITTILSVSRISERKFLLYIDGELCLFLCARNHFSRCFSVFTPSGCWNSNFCLYAQKLLLFTLHEDQHPFSIDAAFIYHGTIFWTCTMCVFFFFLDVTL